MHSERAIVEALKSVSMTDGAAGKPSLIAGMDNKQVCALTKGNGSMAKQLKITNSCGVYTQGVPI